MPVLGKKIILVYLVVIIRTSCSAEGSGNKVTPSEPVIAESADGVVIETIGSDIAEPLPKQEPFTWLGPPFLKRNAPFGSTGRGGSPQERRRFDPHSERKDLLSPFRTSSRDPTFDRPRTRNNYDPMYDKDQPYRPLHPIRSSPTVRASSGTVSENSYQLIRPNLPPSGFDPSEDNVAEESFTNAIVYDRDDTSPGSLQAALKSLWSYKRNTYETLLAKSEAYEKLNGLEGRMDPPSAELEAGKTEEDQDRFNEPPKNIHMPVPNPKMKKPPKVPEERGPEKRPRTPHPPGNDSKEPLKYPRRNPNGRRIPENFPDRPIKILPPRKVSDIPRRMRNPNGRRRDASPEQPPFRPPPFKRNRPNVRRERYPETTSYKRDFPMKGKPSRRRRPQIPDGESIGRNGQAASLYEDFPEEGDSGGAGGYREEASGRWPRSIQLVRPRSRQRETDDPQTDAGEDQDDAYNYDVTILDDEAGYRDDAGEDDYTYLSEEEYHFKNEQKNNVSEDSLGYAHESVPVENVEMDENGNLTEYPSKGSNDSHSSGVLGMGIMDNKNEVDAVEYVDMYEDDLQKLLEDRTSDYELEEVSVPEGAASEGHMSFSTLYSRQGSPRIPGSVAPQTKKTIRMKVSPGKGSGKKIIRMKIRGMDDVNAGKQIANQKEPQSSISGPKPQSNSQHSKPMSKISGTKQKKLQAGYNLPVPSTPTTSHPPVYVPQTTKPPVYMASTSKPSGYGGPPSKPSGYGVPPSKPQGYSPMGYGGKPASFGGTKTGGKKSIFSGLGGTKSGGKRPNFSGYGAPKPGGSMYGGGGGLGLNGLGLNGLKNTVTSTFQQASGIIPDLSKAITVMSFLAFSVFVANLGVNALANSTLGVSFGRESDSSWSFNIEDMIHKVDELFEGPKDEVKSAAKAFESVVNLVETVYDDLHENIKEEVENLSEKVNNYLENNFSEDGLPIGDISKRYLLVEDMASDDLNTNCYRRLLCLSHQLTLRLNISDSRNKMLPFWTFGIGWMKGGQEHVATLLENLRAELAGQTGRNCYKLYAECPNPATVENYVLEVEEELKDLERNKTKWEPISTSSSHEHYNVPITIKYKDSTKSVISSQISETDQLATLIGYKSRIQQVGSKSVLDNFKIVPKSTISRVTLSPQNKTNLND